MGVDPRASGRDREGVRQGGPVDLEVPDRVRPGLLARDGHRRSDRRRIDDDDVAQGITFPIGTNLKTF